MLTQSSSTVWVAELSIGSMYQNLGMISTKSPIVAPPEANKSHFCVLRCTSPRAIERAVCVFICGLHHYWKYFSCSHNSCHDSTGRSDPDYVACFLSQVACSVHGYVQNRVYDWLKNSDVHPLREALAPELAHLLCAVSLFRAVGANCTWAKEATL